MTGLKIGFVGKKPVVTIRPGKGKPGVAEARRKAREEREAAEIAKREAEKSAKE